MKIKLTLLTWVLVAFNTTVHVHAQGSLVPNGVTYGEFIPGFGSTFRVLQNPTNGNYTGFSLPGLDANTFSFLSFADEGVRVFLVSLNNPITLLAIQTSGYTELGNPPVDYIFTAGVPFYLGLYTGDQFPQNGIYPNPMFGWAQLVNNGGVVQLLDGALAYNAAGIYAGTPNIIQLVPEPTALSLIFLGLFGFSHYLRRGSGLKRWQSK